MWKVVGVGGVVREGCLEEEDVSSSFEDKQETGGEGLIQIKVTIWAQAWKEG